LDFTGARDDGVAVASAGPYMQIICTLLQTDNHASASLLSFYRPVALPAACQQRQSTEGRCEYINV